MKYDEDKAQRLRLMVMLTPPFFIIAVALSALFYSRQWAGPWIFVVLPGSSLFLGLALTEMLWRSIDRAGSGLVRLLLGAGNIQPRPAVSHIESLEASGRYTDADEAFRSHCATHPTDLRARLAWARLIQHRLGEPARAITVCQAARERPLTGQEEDAVGNMLIDLYQQIGDRGRWLTELARFGDRNRGTPAGEAARRALLQAKEPDPGDSA